jgi:DNA helicase-2/ATP-dependent DNA helicase PcrA
MILLTAQQQTAVDYPDTIALSSCPGSGKTRTIIAKLMRCIDEIRDTPRRIACITFTNAGVEEIESRLKKYGNSEDKGLCEVSTIHSFCLHNILRPHAHLLPHLNGEWEIITEDDAWMDNLVSELADTYNVTGRLRDEIPTLHRTFPDGIPSSTELPPRLMEDFFRRVDTEKKVMLNDIVYFSTRLVEAHEFIASALAARFAWYIVDEFQDTTLAQTRLFLRIFQQGRSKFFIVGDPNQSILSVAGAHPKLMSRFAQDIGARCDLTLTGNFRCSQLIVDKAELLCGTNPRMTAVGEHREYPHAPQYRNCRTAIEGIVDHFIPAIDQLGIEFGEAAILAPWWRDLLDIGKALRAREIPIIGPGSRPYRRSHDFAMLSEALAAFLGGGEGLHAAAAVQKALFVTLSNLTDTANWQLYRYQGQRVIYRIINVARDAYERHNGALQPWLLDVAQETEAILIAEELLPIALKDVFVNSARIMIHQMHNNDYDVANTSVEVLGMVAQPDKCMNLLSMHKSKGREFDAVAVICVHDGRLPHFTSVTDEQKEESQRLLYVATTRARKLLMYFTDRSHDKNRPSPYLKARYLNFC